MTEEDKGFLKASQIRGWLENPLEGVTDDFDSEAAATLVTDGLGGMIEDATKVIEGLALEYAPQGVSGIADQILDVDS